MWKLGSKKYLCLVNTSSRHQSYISLDSQCILYFLNVDLSIYRIVLLIYIYIFCLVRMLLRFLKPIISKCEYNLVCGDLDWVTSTWEIFHSNVSADVLHGSTYNVWNIIAFEEVLTMSKQVQTVQKTISLCPPFLLLWPVSLSLTVEDSTSHFLLLLPLPFQMMLHRACQWENVWREMANDIAEKYTEVCPEWNWIP